MRILVLLGVLAAPPLVGATAVANMPGSAGFVIALGAALIMMRDAVLICLMMLRHWRLFGRELFLIEESGRERWVDAFELRAIRVPCHVRRREFRLYLLDPPVPD
jgi:hypothetical protein